MTAHGDEPSHSFTGAFRVNTEQGALVLTRTRGDLRLIFNAVTRHDLPARLDGVSVRIPALRSGMASEFRLCSAVQAHSVVARSLQIHERAALYGAAIALPRYPPHRRALWSVLLWVARFRWGQALIRAVRVRDSV